MVNDYAHNVLEAIGSTPVLKLGRIVPSGSATVWAKLEQFNPGGSIKDRICLSMISKAESDGLISPGNNLIVEPTSGNTGIGLALVCAVRGYRLILTMPEDMSEERRMLLSAYGAEVVLTPAEQKMEGAVNKAEEIVSENPGAFMPQQFKNPANPDIHRKTTAVEILSQIDGEIHGFVTGVGTGGTITGMGEILKKEFPNIHITAIEPAESAVLSGEKAHVHDIQGIGAGFVPDVLNLLVYDDIEKVTGEDAKAYTRLLAKEEGIFVGISSGACTYAAIKLAKRLGAGKQVLTVFGDSGERYLSTGVFVE